jgi:hypothetical protein
MRRQKEEKEKEKEKEKKICSNPVLRERIMSLRLALAT